jgi:hypothetical protein
MGWGDILPIPADATYMGKANLKKRLKSTAVTPSSLRGWASLDPSTGRSDGVGKESMSQNTWESAKIVLGTQKSVSSIQENVGLSTRFGVWCMTYQNSDVFTVVFSIPLWHIAE